MLWSGKETEGESGREGENPEGELSGGFQGHRAFPRVGPPPLGEDSLWVRPRPPSGARASVGWGEGALRRITLEFFHIKYTS